MQTRRISFTLFCRLEKPNKRSSKRLSLIPVRLLCGYRGYHVS